MCTMLLIKANNKYCPPLYASPIMWDSLRQYPLKLLNTFLMRQVGRNPFTDIGCTTIPRTSAIVRHHTNNHHHAVLQHPNIQYHPH